MKKIISTASILPLISINLYYQMHNTKSLTLRIPKMLHLSQETLHSNKNSRLSDLATLYLRSNSVRIGGVVEVPFSAGAFLNAAIYCRHLIVTL